MVRLALALLVFGGCGWKADGLARLEEQYPTRAPVVPDAGAGTPIDLGTPRCLGFDGTWAVRLVQNNTISPVVEPWRMVVTDLFLAESSGQSFSLRFCDQQTAITTTSSAPTELGRAKVPAALQAALARTPVTLTLPGDGTFRAEKLVWLWGLSGLTQPLTDLLPNKDNYLGDARVWDQDGDGKPGVTLNIVAPAGDRHMVRRAIWTFEPGKLSFDNQRISGALTSAITESGLTATNMLLLTPAPITPRAEGSLYQLRCVGPTYTCGALAVDHPRLFP